MFTRLVIMAISLHLCSSSLDNATVRKTYHFPHKKLVLSESSFDNTTLFYALCSQPPNQCTVVHVMNPFVNSSVTRKCDVTLQADNVQLVTGFGMDKAIVITQESEDKLAILRLTLVHMPSCTVTDAELLEIPAKWKGLQLYRRHMDVVVFQDGFEIIIKGLSEICDTVDKKTYCSFEFNMDGKRIEGPIVWPKTPYKITNVSSPIIPDKLGRWYFFIDENATTLTGIQMNRNGGPTYVKLWGPTQLHGNNYWSVGYSVANEAYGMCYSENFTVRCWQLILHDRRRMKKEFTINHEHETWNIYVQNLREGGFIVLMINCPNRICAGVKDQYYLMKIDAQGKMMGHLDINLQSNCNAKNGDILAKVYENEQGLYCAVRLCKSRPQAEAKFEKVIHCYTDDQFSKPIVHA